MCRLHFVRLKFVAVVVLTQLLATVLLTAEVPNMVSYQGRVTASGVPFTGTGLFKFALVVGDGAGTVWSNNGTSISGSEPSAYVWLPVTNGNFSVMLGDISLPNMIPVSPSYFANPDLKLRVWFNDGTNGFSQLTPDQRIGSTPFAMSAATATTATSATTSTGVNQYPSAPASNAGSIYFNTSDQKVYVSNGTAWQPLVTATTPPATYRWAVWHTYDQANGWFFGDGSVLTGGVTPSTWSDNSGKAYQISSNKTVQAALFNKQAVVSPNSLVWAETYHQNSSTDAKMVGALFRIRNKTGSAINWTASFYATCYGAWGENISVSLNGASTYVNTGNVYPQTGFAVSLSIPANRVSTLIVVGGSSPGTALGGGYTRSAVLAFYNNCLNLPNGLEFVDDLNTATGGYEQ